MPIAQDIGIAINDVHRREREMPSRYDVEDRNLKNAALALEQQRANEDQAIQAEEAPERLRVLGGQADLLTDPTEVALRRRRAEAEIRNLDEPNRYQPPQIRLETDDKGITTAIKMYPDGRIEKENLGNIGTTARARGGGFVSPMFANVPGVGYGMIDRRHPGAGIIPGTEGYGPPGTADERSSMALLRTATGSLAALEKALGDVEAANKVSGGWSITNPLDSLKTAQGPVTGRVGNFYRDVVDSSGVGGDFDRAAAQMRTVIYGLSGKQLNQSELTWLDSMLPNLRDPGARDQLRRLRHFTSLLIRAKQEAALDPFGAGSDPFSVARAEMEETEATFGAKQNETPLMLQAPPKAKAAVPGEAAGVTGGQTPPRPPGVPPNAVFDPAAGEWVEE